jgi:GT2 family glycosyltransferase
LKQEFKYKISIIIVNYNVEFFLEQCLNSVRKGLEHVNGEVFVVDNNSIDGSVEMVQRKFPEVHLIANKDNRGFSKANNQATLLSQGEYILLLNPDTVVEEDTFSKVIEFMDQHPDAGGLGVRMLDGKGKFLPESKRGLPTPAVAFYKIFGLSRIFPQSKRFGKYHLGYLSEFAIHEIDILSGAFMLMRKEALDKVGLLDEAFFMYGEDIDLSYRIQKGGYKNYYFPETRIIHYKGESTKKSSVNYVFVFYRAMVIFAKKHFSQKNAWLFSFLINAAIYFRASLAILARFIKKATLPVIDFTIITAGMFALTNYWKINGIQFPSEVIYFAIPIYAFTWLTSILFCGGYDSPVRMKKFPFGTVVGLLIILIFYGLLPKDWQFSRLFILSAALWTIIYFIFSRVFLHFAIGKMFSLSPVRNKRFVIVGSVEEFKRISDLLKQTGSKIDIVELVSPGEEKETGAVGTINQLDQVVHIHGINEIIFSARDNTAGTIIQWMSLIASNKVDFKIAQPETLFLIGSNSIETAGDLYVLNINSISRTDKIRAKRTFDIFCSLSVLILSPLLIFSYQHKSKFLLNLVGILFGKYSFVGYALYQFENGVSLPRIKKGLLSPLDGLPFEDVSLGDKMNLIYARDYSIHQDFLILTKAWKKLDR